MTVVIAAVAVAAAVLVPASGASARPAVANLSNAVVVADDVAIAQILADTNAVRASAGKPALRLSLAMNNVAMAWTQQMAAAGQLSHNPYYSAQIPAGWTRAAENVAYGQRYDTVVAAWAASSGHLANMTGDYTDIGIGVIDLNGQRYFTQNFGKYATAPAAPAPTFTASVDRVSGADRYAVAIGIAQRAYPGTAPVVYVATGENFPDALSAAPAAAQDGGPLLLTPTASLRGDVANEIRRLNPGRIVVVGGANSVTDAVLNQLAAIQPNTTRLWGSDRYSASRALVRYAFPSGASTVYVATGTNFPDALSAAAAGGTTGAPVLLVNGGSPSLDRESLELLQSLHPSRIIVAGGVGSVSASIESTLRTVATVLRMGGATRYEASVSITDEAFDRADHVFLATGMTFPDALAGSAWAASLPAPLIIVPQSCIPAGTITQLRTLGVTRVTLLGGLGSLTQNVTSLRSC